MWKGLWCGIAKAGGRRSGPREDLEGRLTRLARSQDGEGWLASGLRSDLDRHYRQSQTTFSLDSGYWGSSGTGATPGSAGADPDGATGYAAGRWYRLRPP